MNVLAPILFLVFLGAAAPLLRGGRLETDPRRRRAARLFVAVATLACLGPGLVQRDAWPFSVWPLVALVQPDEVVHPRIVAVDEDGSEHDIDARAWEPLVVDELISWVNTRFPRLDPPAREEAARSLLGWAEAGRARARAGAELGTRRRRLGPLAAPYFLLHPAPWSDTARVPARRFTGLRVYEERWSLEARHAGTGTTARRLLYELR